MNQERAILHFNKFKSLKNEYVTDTLKGQNYRIVKVKMIKLSDIDYAVKISIQSDIDNKVMEIDSVYANQNYKEISR